MDIIVGAGIIMSPDDLSPWDPESWEQERPDARPEVAPSEATANGRLDSWNAIERRGKRRRRKLVGASAAEDAVRGLADRRADC